MQENNIFILKNWKKIWIVLNIYGIENPYSSVIKRDTWPNLVN